MRDYLVDMILRAMIALARAIPWRARVALVGWITARIIAPYAGYDRRIRDNLARVWPELPASEVARLVHAVPANAGRTLIEVYSGAEFVERAAGARITGAGLAALEAAKARGQGAILLSGHFGNYDVARAVLGRRGMPVGALYQPWSNRRFDVHYRRIIGAISGPIFPRGRQGLVEMVRHLRAGGFVGILHDQRMEHGASLRFFGHDALTALSAAEMALRHDLLLVPVYGVRQPDGIGFDLVIEAPIPHATPEAMMQAANDSLEAMVRAHPEQWFWVHRRWGAPG